MASPKSIAKKVQEGLYPNKEVLFNLYIIQNLSVSQMSEILDIPVSTLYRILQYFQLQKSHLQINKAKENTCLKKYGCRYAAQSTDIKNKIQQTCLQKYGATSSVGSTEIRAKIENTMLKKYGVKRPLQNDVIRRRQVETMKNRYGVSYDMQRPDGKERRQKTCQEKYGVNWASQRLDLRQSYHQKSLERYNGIFKSKDSLLGFLQLHPNSKVEDLLSFTDCSYSKLIQSIHKFKLTDYVNMKPQTSIYEDEIQTFLENNSIYVTRNIRNKIGGRKEIDVFCPEYNVGIEFNGSYWHSDKIKDNNYHQQKSLQALKHGIFLYQIAEHDWINNNQTKIMQHFLTQINPVVDDKYCEVKLNLAHENPIPYLKQGYKIVKILKPKCVTWDRNKKRIIANYYIDSQDHNIVHVYDCGEIVLRKDLKGE